MLGAGVDAAVVAVVAEIPRLTRRDWLEAPSAGHQARVHDPLPHRPLTPMPRPIAALLRGQPNPVSLPFARTSPSALELLRTRRLYATSPERGRSAINSANSRNETAARTRPPPTPRRSKHVPPLLLDLGIRQRPALVQRPAMAEVARVERSRLDESFESQALTRHGDET
jgi:hypothetical protein